MHIDGIDVEKQRAAKAMLGQLAERIPETLMSVERQRFIGDELVGRLSIDDQLVMRRFYDECLRTMRRLEASDIDLGGWGAGSQIWLRIHGDKKPVEDFGQFTTDEFDIFIQNLLMESQRHHLYDNRNLDFSYILREGDELARHRADAYFDMDSLALNMRAINTEVRPYEGYGFHPNVTRNLSLEHSKEGLNLITGITGSGKSTTLDSIINMNNSAVDAHVVIIAAPIEYVHNSDRCIIRHREVGRDTTSFKRGTIESLRQDPDIIMIGEMRDPETIMAALEVADSGHKVFSTLHTSSAIESIDRVIGEVPPIEQERVRNRLADILRVVVSQKLVPSTDGKRVLAKEILIMTASTRAAIKNNNTNEIYQMINEGLRYGMTTMEQDLKTLVVKRKITKDTAMNYSNNKRMMQQLLQSM